PDLRGENALHEFVLETRIGYCEYFATAMAVMLRTANIPTRVSVGFLPGTRALDEFRTQNTWIVSTSDAHAWVEVLFPGIGWVKFDPTPRTDGATFVPTVDDLNPQLSLAELIEQGERDPLETPSVDPSEGEATPTASPTAGELASGGAGEVPGDADAMPLWLLVVIGLLGAMAAIVVLGRWADRRPAATDPVGRVIVAQGRVHDEAERLGQARQPAETIHETAARLARSGRAGPQTLHRLADLATAAAFGRRADEQTATEAEQLAGVAIAELRSTASRTDRLTAPMRRPWQRGRHLWTRAWARGWDLWSRLRD
ncbi:MAG: transglutaminase domain-containing protein, partial [Nitriliruptorales bacterium]|nr:transglutaminase domain-containing protein [Nitriliruptorales bacterium]